MKDKGLIYNKCITFSLRVIKLNQYLQNNCPYNIANQIQRSGTSIGANYSESLGAESDQDFIHKLSISQKEIFETQYWLDILFKGEFLDSKLYHSFMPTPRNYTNSFPLPFSPPATKPPTTLIIHKS